MTKHRDHCHHRPRVKKTRDPYDMFGVSQRHRWHATCACGWSLLTPTWRSAHAHAFEHSKLIAA